MRFLRSIVLGCMIFILARGIVSASTAPDRDRGLMMLKSLRLKLQQEYYDSALKGFPLDKKCAEAAQRIAKAGSNSQIFRSIGQVFLDLDDSHTIFIPPQRAVRVNYGWTTMTVGNACFVRWVDPKSDAAKKGLVRGDQIESINGIPASRATLWKINYLFQMLDPQPGLHVVARSPSGQSRPLALAADIKQDNRVLKVAGDSGSQDLSKLVLRSQNWQANRKSVFAEIDGTLIWRLPGFDRPPSDLDDGLARLRSAKSLIIDIRGNGGGYQATLIDLLSHVFQRDVEVGLLVKRTEKRVLKASSADSAFGGLLIVLVDAQSASGSELFARVLQLEDRGIVIGDRTMGAVQQAKIFTDSVDVNPIIPFGLEVTTATILMRDGSSLEKNGVVPDFPILPTGSDLLAGRDPVLAFALARAGHTMTAEAAGKLLPPDLRDEPVN